MIGPAERASPQRAAAQRSAHNSLIESYRFLYRFAAAFYAALPRPVLNAINKKLWLGGQMSKCISLRVARGCGAALIVAAWIVGASNESHAAIGRADLGELSRRNVAVPRSTTLAGQVKVSQVAMAASDLVGFIFDEPFAEAASPAAELRFTPAGSAIQGIASTYDPRNTDDQNAGSQEMASGESYDPNGWNAAIRVDLRDKFGGVNFGKDYRPSYALVESREKCVIVKINDVGSLDAGRIIDLNIRTMRYFDPSLNLGLIYNVKVIPLVGTDMPLGPVKNDAPTNFAGWFT